MIKETFKGDDNMPDISFHPRRRVSGMNCRNAITAKKIRQKKRVTAVAGVDAPNPANALCALGTPLPRN